MIFVLTAVDFLIQSLFLSYILVSSSKQTILSLWQTEDYFNLISSWYPEPGKNAFRTILDAMKSIKSL